MKLNNKGFAIAGIVYSMLILFLVLVVLIIGNLANRKVVFDQEKNGILNKINGEDVIVEEPGDADEGVIEETTLCKFVSGQKGKIGAKYTCNPGDGERTFYILEDGDNPARVNHPNGELAVSGIAKAGQVSLIMNRSFDEGSAWITPEDYKKAGGEITENMKNDGSYCQYSSDARDCAGNSKGPITALKYLASQTNHWTSDKIISIDLPTYAQIFCVNNSTNLTSSSWLFDNTFVEDSEGNIVSNYWTSTGDTWYDYNAYCVGNTLYTNHVVLGTVGVRPVITISKDQLGD